ncbi:prepilin peptidase [Herbidospora galbida]|uniref:Prepilin peptidase n=1 Tax=Herbidospora galbida TaxID=2575442 RepID=A0A4V6XB44_9ACTN|nr:A24 family peptidase [Herbidospora galbida]TKK77353.1 prepilin peptidase [Herbidospora galbida]
MLSWGLLALLGVVAGRYARELAGGFVPEPDDTRKEALAALRHAVGVVPVPRPPFVVEAVTGLLFGVLAWRYAPTPELVPALLLAAWAGVVLTITDLRTWRLPDVVTLPAYPVLLVALAPTGRLMVAAACGLAMAGIYLVLWFGRPSGIGFGDVKLAGLVGLVAGAVGVDAAVIAGVGGQLLGGLWALGLLITRKGTRTSEFPFGPAMIAGALAALLAGA